MKVITAVVKPFKVDEVRAALLEIGIRGMTATEARGYGYQRRHTEIYRGAEYVVASLPKIRIEIAVADSDVDRVMECVINSAKTGQVGDGKIWVTPIERIVRIRTAEEAELAV